MTELADLIPSPKEEAQRQFRRARVISVSGRSLTVDLDSGAGGAVIPSVDSCNPVPDQWVLILVDGSTMLAVAALNGVYRQPTLIAISDQTATVTGLVNGVSTAVTKVGTFTAVAGEEFPLVWSADGSGVWVLAKAGAAYTPPPPSGGGGGGGGGTPSSYTTNYSATSSGWFSSTGGAGNGTLMLAAGRTGYFNYGTNRMNELQGRTLLSGRIYLVRSSGSGSVSARALKGGVFSSTATLSPGGWLTLPPAVVAHLVAGSGATAMRLTGSGNISGIPAGTIQITWR